MISDIVLASLTVNQNLMLVQHPVVQSANMISCACLCLCEREIELL